MFCRVLISQKSFQEKAAEWEDVLMKHKISEACNNLSTLELFQNIDLPEKSDNLNMQTQCDYLSEIPNAAKWLWTLDDPSKQQVKFGQRLSTSQSFPPSSPRNRIIRAVAVSGDNLEESFGK